MSIPPWRLIILAGIASFCSNWSFAFQITYVNTSVDTFYSLARKAYRISRECSSCYYPEQEWLTEWSFIVSMIYPGTIFGFLLVPLLIKWVGVKKSQEIMCFSTIIGILVHFLALHFLSLGISLKNRHIKWCVGETFFSIFLSTGRFLIGIQAGSALCLLPLYIIEISPHKYITFLNNFQQVSQSLATLLGLILGSEEILPLGNSRYIIMQFAALTPIIVLLVLLLITPQTPTFWRRFGQNQLSEVTKSNLFYYGYEYNVMEQLSLLELDSISRKPDDIRPTEWSKSIKGFMIGTVVACSYSFTGDDLIDTYSSNMLKNENSLRGTFHERADTFTIILSDIFGLVLFISSLFGLYLADQYGRRTLVLTGLIGTFLANIGASIFSSNKIHISLFFAFTKICIGLGCGGPAWFITSELVSNEHAWLFQPLSTGILLLSTMIETFLYLYVDSVFGNYSMILLAAIPALISAIIIYLYLPETKGKSKNEILYQLNSNHFCGIFAKKITTTSTYGTYHQNNDLTA